MSVSSSASATACSSSGDQRRNAPWWGCRPRPTRSTTVTPSGVTGFCGSRPRVRATCREGSVAISWPSSSTEPVRGPEQSRHPPQQRGLAAGVGADDDRRPAVGDLGGQVGDDRAVAVPEAHPVGHQPAAAGGAALCASGPSRPPRGASGGQQPQQERGSEGAGHDADGVVHVGHGVRREVVAADDDDRPDQPGADQRRPATVERAGDRPGQEGDERDRTRGRDAERDQQDREQQQELGVPRRGAEPGGGVLAELGGPRPRDPARRRPAASTSSRTASSRIVGQSPRLRLPVSHCSTICTSHWSARTKR